MKLRAEWVLPIAGPPLHHGVVTIAGDRISAIEPAAEAAARAVAGRSGAPRTPASSASAAVSAASAAEPDVDLGAAILMPGLVNPHAHLELTAYAGLLPPTGLWDWFPQLVRLRRAPGQVEREQAGVLAGAWESLRAGVTCVGDISRRNLNWSILRTLPIRKVCFVELLTLADDPPRNPDELRAAVAEVQEDDLLTVGITPHTPFTVPPDQIRAAVTLATELDRPWCLHWLETREEAAFVAGDDHALPGYMGSLLAQCGVQSPRAIPAELLARCTDGLRPGLLAHGNYVPAGDVARLAATGHAVAYCPRSHAFFGHRDHPFRTMQAAGVTVALGTDSSASNSGLGVLDEARHVWHQPDPPAADTLLRMITSDAARALGLADRVGSLTPGLCADLVAFPCPPGTRDPAATLLSETTAPLGVWVAGQRVA